MYEFNKVVHRFVTNVEIQEIEQKKKGPLEGIKYAWTIPVFLFLLFYWYSFRHPKNKKKSNGRIQTKKNHFFFIKESLNNALLKYSFFFYLEERENIYVKPVCLYTRTKNK